MTRTLVTAAVLSALAAATLPGCGLFAKKGPAAPAASSGPPGATSAAVAKPAPAVAAAKPAPLPPAFSHENHLGRGVGCLDCHEGADTADKAAMPTLEQCMDCHEEIEEAAPPEKKVAQFVDKASGKVKWANWTRQPDGIVFSHAKHAAKGVECSNCHAAIEKNHRTGPELGMKMDGCVDCHGETTSCAACHPKIGREFEPSNHDPRWMAAHGGIIRTGKPRGAAEDCTLCHEPPSCIDCHRKTPPADHTRAFRAGPAHGAKYESAPQRCSMCHTPDTCSSCHAATTPEDHKGTWSKSAVHGIAAQADPARCAMCHTETTCISCHRDQPPRDHNQYWRNGPGHGLASSMDRDRCAACHTTDQCVACHTTNPPRSHTGAWGAPRARHCLHCHEGDTAQGQGGCATCHRGTPSHRLAPPKPDDHRADSECRMCHDKLRHAVNDQNCNECHR